MAYEGNYYSGNTYEVYLWDVKGKKQVNGWSPGAGGGWTEWVRKYPECAYGQFKV